MKILFATGGTAGHINPALAVASYIRENYPETQILFIGTADHMEARLVPNAGFDFKTIEISGFRRSLSPSAISHNIKTVSQLIKSESKSKKSSRNFLPMFAWALEDMFPAPCLRKRRHSAFPYAFTSKTHFPVSQIRHLQKSR